LSWHPPTLSLVAMVLVSTAMAGSATMRWSALGLIYLLYVLKMVPPART